MRREGHPCLLTVQKVVVLGVLRARLAPLASLEVGAAAVGAVGGAAPAATELLVLLLDDESLHRRPHHPRGPRGLLRPGGGGGRGRLLQVRHVGVLERRARYVSEAAEK